MRNWKYICTIPLVLKCGISPWIKQIYFGKNITTKSSLHQQPFTIHCWTNTSSYKGGFRLIYHAGLMDIVCSKFFFYTFFPFSSPTPHSIHPILKRVVTRCVLYPSPHTTVSRPLRRHIFVIILFICWPPIDICPSITQQRHY